MTLARAAVHPSFGVIAKSVEQVQRRIRARTLAVRIRAACRRRSRARPLRSPTRKVCRAIAPRGTPGVGQPRLRSGNDEHRSETPERRLHLPIGRIVDRRAVDHERVRVVVRREDVARRAPDALFVLLHRQPRLPDRDDDLLGVGRAQPEGDATVGADVRRLDRRRPRPPPRPAGRRLRGRRVAASPAAPPSARRTRTSRRERRSRRSIVEACRG